MLALLAFGLLARNRRRVLARRGVRGALAAAGAVAAMIAMPRHASAQVDPYWQHAEGSGADAGLDTSQPNTAVHEAGSADDWNSTSGRPAGDIDTSQANTAGRAYDETTQVGPFPSHWIAGVRVAPYTPQIDAQLGGASPGPYKQMFGGATVLPMLDFERVVWSGGGGQVTAGATIGYLGRTANAFTDTSAPTDPNRARAGDTNSFRLIPIALMAGYRLTYLDEELGIPIVPYVRGGLAYDVWWITAPNGGFAQVCEGGGSEPNCMQNKAAGASAGLTGEIGLAIRAERLDGGAAATMRDSGILHAGFYLELSLSKVDGFGSSTPSCRSATTRSSAA